jgi:prepilin-type N-terminal cleavage/methylation domain-containing protein
MTSKGNRRGFTLIELLVVVSIVVLLVSILLPAVGQVRTQARISVCTQNMKQHGIGQGNYSAANGDYLPHAPKAPPSSATNEGGRPYGIPGRPARRYATEDFPINGFRFRGGDSGGVYTLYGCGNAELRLADGRLTWQELQMTTGYWVVMAEFMTDGEGIAALSETVFTSPADVIGQDTVEFVREDLDDRDGRWPNLDNQGVDYDLLSYRYISPALVDDLVFTWTTSGATGAFGPAFPSVAIGDTPFEDERTFYQFVRRRSATSVQFPSNKVLFFMWNAWHNPDLEAWFQPGAVIPVALADGSARATIPYRDGLYKPNSSFGDERENAGPYFNYIFSAGGSNVSSSTESWPAHYFATYGGLRGRDLQN